MVRIIIIIMVGICKLKLFNQFSHTGYHASSLYSIILDTMWQPIFEWLYNDNVSHFLLDVVYLSVAVGTRIQLPVYIEYAAHTVIPLFFTTQIRKRQKTPGSSCCKLTNNDQGQGHERLRCKTALGIFGKSGVQRPYSL